MTEVLNLIDGRLVPAQSNQTLRNWEPATGHLLGTVPDSDESDIEVAARAAETAWPQWQGMPSSERGQWLRRLAAGIAQESEAFALAESKDTGKPIALARSVDIPRAELNCEFFADAATQFFSESYTTPNTVHYTLRSPLGLVGAISPWNLPLYLLTWKIAPALVAGNCVVAKPSELAPETAFLFSKLAVAIGFPKGVLNIVHGTGISAGRALVRNSCVQAISFTGSTQTGREILRSASERFAKTSLEMGGKNATLVFADADLENAIKTSVRAAFSNQGQICLCGSRILIEESIYLKFREKFLEQVADLRAGDPLEETTSIGALISDAHLQKVLRYLEIAKREGGRVLMGGNRAALSGRCKDGFFAEPTVIEGLGMESQVNQDEIFGPVVTMMSFKDDATAIALANASRYGLSASVWTGNVTRAMRMSELLEVGMVWVNGWMQRDLRTPFGGMKESGMGREGGLEAMRFFTEPKSVSIQY